MAGPWEQYAAPAAPEAASGPWSQYAPPAQTADARTGAPANVRAAVGAAQTPEDRLATLRRFYPDARPEGADNFLFRDPRTQRPTLYNPPGLDLGDVASVVPEIGEAVGGTIGGALALPPAVAGAPVTGGASALAVPAGIGLGAAAGREVATLGASLLGPTVDTRSAGRRIGDAATTAGINAVAGPVADAAVAGARRVLGPVGRVLGGRGLASPDDFAQAGVRASAGDVTGNPLTQTAQLAAGSALGGTRRMAPFMEGQTDDLGRAVARTAEEIGTPTTPGNAGAIVREGAGRAVQRFEARQADLYDQAFAMIGADSRVSFPRVQALRQEIAAEIAQAPNSAGARLAPVLRRIDALLADSADGGLPFGAMRRERTALGRTLGAPAPSASAPNTEVQPYLQRLYGSLTEDMTTHATAAGDDAARALSLADRYTRFNRNLNLPALERVQRQGTDQQVYDMLFPRSGRADAQSLNRVLRNLQPEERSAVAATVLDRLGTPNPGSQAAEDFSAATFLTNWNRLTRDGPAARRVLFGGENAELGQSLDRLVRVASSMRDTARYTNWSGTARIGLAGATAASIGNPAMDGDVGGVVQAVGLSLVAPNIAVRLMTNPRFVNWLAGAAPTIAREGISTSLFRSLGRVGAVNPEMRDAVEQYRAAITSRQVQQ